MTPRVLLPGDPEWPPGADERWVASRKEELLRRLDEGEIGLNEALARFCLTVEEVEDWRSRHKVYGRRGLNINQRRKVAQIQGRLL